MITNQNTGEVFTAETGVNYNYYQFMLANGTDVNAREILRFNVTSPDGEQSKIFDHTIDETEINNGGIFNFNINDSSIRSINSRRNREFLA